MRIHAHSIDSICWIVSTFCDGATSTRCRHQCDLFASGVSSRPLLPLAALQSLKSLLPFRAISMRRHDFLPSFLSIASHATPSMLLWLLWSAEIHLFTTEDLATPIVRNKQKYNWICPWRCASAHRNRETETSDEMHAAVLAQNHKGTVPKPRTGERRRYWNSITKN